MQMVPEIHSQANGLSNIWNIPTQGAPWPVSTKKSNEAPHFWREVKSTENEPNTLHTETQRENNSIRFVQNVLTLGKYEPQSPT